MATNSLLILLQIGIQVIESSFTAKTASLLKEMAEKGFVEQVAGLGKGKYRFISHMRHYGGGLC